MQYHLDEITLLECANKLVEYSPIEMKYINKQAMISDVVAKLNLFTIPENLDLNKIDALDKSCDIVARKVYIIVSGTKRADITDLLKKLDRDYSSRSRSRFLKCFREILGTILKTFWIMFTEQYKMSKTSS